MGSSWVDLAECQINQSNQGVGGGGDGTGIERSLAAKSLLSFMQEMVRTVIRLESRLAAKRIDRGRSHVSATAPPRPPRRYEH